jgi:hypothetical protein
MWPGLKSARMLTNCTNIHRLQWGQEQSDPSGAETRWQVSTESKCRVSQVGRQVPLEGFRWLP